jgi:hypothetical protein
MDGWLLLAACRTEKEDKRDKLRTSEPSDSSSLGHSRNLGDFVAEKVSCCHSGECRVSAASVERDSHSASSRESERRDKDTSSSRMMLLFMFENSMTASTKTLPVLFNLFENATVRRNIKSLGTAIITNHMLYQFLSRLWNREVSAAVLNQSKQEGGVLGNESYEMSIKLGWEKGGQRERERERERGFIRVTQQILMLLIGPASCDMLRFGN